MISDEELLAQIEQGILTDQPVTNTLRALLLLGGRLNSGKLGDWAKRELNGYYGVEDDQVPEMRTVGAPILINAIVGYTQITGQSVSALALPSPYREVLKDDVILRQPVSEIESMITTARQAGNSFITLTIPNWEFIARDLDKNVFGQHTTMIYRQVSLSYLDAILSDVGNSAAELLGEFRKANTGKNHSLPRGTKADEIVKAVVVTGDNNSIVVASGKQKAIRSATRIAPTSPDPEKGGWWNAWGKAATIIGSLTGVVTIAIITFVTLSTGSIPAP